MSRCLRPGLPSPNGEEEVSWRSLVARALPARPRTQSQASGDGAYDLGLPRSQSRMARGEDLRSRFRALLGCSSLLHTRDRGSRGAAGAAEPRSGRSLIDAAESQAQSPVTPETEWSLWPWELGNCLKQLRSSWGRRGGLPSVAPVPCSGLFYSRPQFPHTNFSRLIQSFPNPAFVAGSLQGFGGLTPGTRESVQ